MSPAPPRPVPARPRRPAPPPTSARLAAPDLGPASRPAPSPSSARLAVPRRPRPRRRPAAPAPPRGAAPGPRRRPAALAHPRRRAPAPRRRPAPAPPPSAAPLHAVLRMIRLCKDKQRAYQTLQKAIRSMDIVRAAKLLISSLPVRAATDASNLRCYADLAIWGNILRSLWCGAMRRSSLHQRRLTIRAADDILPELAAAARFTATAEPQPRRVPHCDRHSRLRCGAVHPSYASWVLLSDNRLAILEFARCIGDKVFEVFWSHNFLCSNSVLERHAFCAVTRISSVLERHIFCAATRVSSVLERNTLWAAIRVSSVVQWQPFGHEQISSIVMTSKLYSAREK
ncbi:hypothetical protein EJB05_26770, partial [Eragrostis curvula]